MISVFLSIFLLLSQSPSVSSNIVYLRSENNASSDKSVIFYIDGEDVDLEANSFYSNFGIVHSGKDKSKLLTIHNPTQEERYISIGGTASYIHFTPANSLTIPTEGSINIIFTLSIQSSKASRIRDSFFLQMGNEQFLCNYEFWLQPNQRSIMIKNNDTHYIVDGERVSIGEIRPFILHDRMLAGVRFFVDHLGFQVWRPMNDNFSSVTMFYDDNTFYFQDGNDRIIVNGEPIYCDPIHLVHHGRMCLPIRFLAEYAGYEVMWDPAEEKVILLWDKLGGEE